ncbi:MAG TPA: SGNH/GDSL hydrolase family protein [Xenococcaceae cyanobacterium]
MLPNFDRAYFFGDSLSDTGNVLKFTDGAFPNFPYALGRFSNGNIWVDSFAEELDITVEPFLPGLTSHTVMVDEAIGGINFAIGGATSGDENEGIVPLGLEQQIDTFEFLVRIQELDAMANEDHEDDIIINGDEHNFLNDDLFFLWVGANDYFSFIQDDPTTPDIVEANFPDTGKELKNTVLEVVDINIAGAIQDIVDLGGENIVVFNLPDLEDTPLGQNLAKSDRKALRKLTNRHNRRLSNYVEDFEASNPDINLIHIDVNELIDDIVDEPNAFGFTNVTDNFTGIDLYAEISQPPATGNPNEYLYWDSVHPTTTVHNLINDLVVDELTDEGLIV